MAQIIPPAAATGTSSLGDPARLERKRLFTAFALTPMLAGFYPAILLAEPAVMPISLVLAYASCTLFGIPLVWFFGRHGVREWWLYVVGGGLCALPTVLLYALLPLPEYLTPFGTLPALALLFWGGASGLVFWMIGIAGDSPVSLRSLFDPVPRK